MVIFMIRTGSPKKVEKRRINLQEYFCIFRCKILTSWLTYCQIVDRSSSPCFNILSVLQLDIFMETLGQFPAPSVATKPVVFFF